MSDWSSDVCSSDLNELRHHRDDSSEDHRPAEPYPLGGETEGERAGRDRRHQRALGCAQAAPVADLLDREARKRAYRSEEHTSELQSLMRISYAVFCLKQKNTPKVLK